MYDIIQALEQLTYSQMVSLEAHWKRIKDSKDPVNVAYAKQREKLMAEHQKKTDLRNESLERIVFCLKPILKPGMRLKMKGCKDGKGLREFIKWDENDNLVCWQIIVARKRIINGAGVVGQVCIAEEKTNIVTTHMPDKIQMIQVASGGQLVPLSKLIS
jgi:hypothetical protein